MCLGESLSYCESHMTISMPVSIAHEFWQLRCVFVNTISMIEGLLGFLQ